MFYGDFMIFLSSKNGQIWGQTPIKSTPIKSPLLSQLIKGVRPLLRIKYGVRPLLRTPNARSDPYYADPYYDNPYYDPTEVKNEFSIFTFIIVYHTCSF